MTSIPRYLSDDETTVVLAALQPLYYRTFDFEGRGSFSDFGRLPQQVRDTINHALTEHQGAISEYRVYREETSSRSVVYYVLGLASSGSFIALSPLLNPPTPHVLELAAKATRPWSFWHETKQVGLKGFAAIGICLLIGISGYLIDHNVLSQFFLAAGITGLGLVYLRSPFLHYRRGLKVAKALLELEVRKSEPPPQSPEDIIRARGGTFGPEKPEPKTA